MSGRLLNYKQSFDSYRRIYSWLVIGLALCAIVISGNAMTNKSSLEKRNPNVEVKEKGKENGIKHVTKTAAKKTATGTKIAAKATAKGTIFVAKKTASGTKTAAKKVVHPKGGKQK